MTDAQLTTLSTFAWLVGTVVLFILLARWSDGGSWGISTAVAHGLTSWSSSERRHAGSGLGGGDLRPMLAQTLDRLRGSDAGVADADVAVSRDAPADANAIAELVDLGARQLP